jgi:hypothetical protein
VLFSNIVLADTTNDVSFPISGTVTATDRVD